jgi:hypothetical protein
LGLRVGQVQALQHVDDQGHQVLNHFLENQSNKPFGKW